MNLDAFLARRRDGLCQLSRLLDRLFRPGLSALSQDQLEALGRLYRRAASDLAYARVRFNGPEILSYLNQLVARGQAAIYAPPRPRSGRLWATTVGATPCSVPDAAPFPSCSARSSSSAPPRW